MTFPPTQEQQAILDAFNTGFGVVIAAAAGTGKTTTLRLIAEQTNRRGLYLAYNKASQLDAEASFPSNIECRTSHSVAYRWLMREWGGYQAINARTNAPRMSSMQTARAMGSNSPARVSEDKVLAPQQLSRIAMETVQRFCFSADPEPSRVHVPYVRGVDTHEARAALIDAVLPLAQKAWRTDLSRKTGNLKFTLDHALKLWSLARPELPFEFICLDEAQDTNPCVGSVFGAQDAQKIVVGDSNQAIYGWRGAEDAMEKFDAPHRLQLTQSWRFGQAVADEANKWLTVLESDMQVTGNPGLPTVIEPCPNPDAILTRTNAGAIDALMVATARGVKAGLVGGGDAIKRMAQAAIDLKSGKGTSHPELFLFESWGAVQDYCDQSHDGGDLAVFVKLIDEHGPETIIQVVDKAFPEADAQVVVSTAHKAKGREWGKVRIGTDFSEPLDEDGQPGECPPPEAMLAYVSVTRARNVLDRGGLAWVDQQPALGSKSKVA